jgi:hypothetical protein
MPSSIRGSDGRGVSPFENVETVKCNYYISAHFYIMERYHLEGIVGRWFCDLKR